MSPEQILFLIISVATLGSALMVVTTRNLMYAALWLIAALFGVAILYVILNATFLAVAQVVIYIGAIATLMIFAIMLTQRSARFTSALATANWGWALTLSALLFAGLVFVLGSMSGMGAQSADLSQIVRDGKPVSEFILPSLGNLLLAPTAYLLQFETASVLLLAALVGSIVIAWQRNPKPKQKEQS
jgi:NADH-quinone oxidoreductase subunit J